MTETPVQDLQTFAYVVPLERFIYQRDGRWIVGETVGKEGITNHLLEVGWKLENIKTCLAERSYMKVYGTELVPNGNALHVTEEGRAFLNTWVPPTIKPAPGEYPRIEAILRFLADNDEGGVEWLCHWLALKVQNPAIVPKVAVVFTTKPGAGKGTLAKILRIMLGPENCATIEGSALESRFNARWATKLFVLADEVLTSESVKDVSNRLKVLIDAETIELEGKGENQREVRNRLAWMFASNDDVAPVMLEVGDRRYSVFSNHREIGGSEYESLLKDCWEPDLITPTESFAAEIAAFYHDLLALQVDRRLVARPYANAARTELIEANLPVHRLFLQTVDDRGIDFLLDRVVVQGDWSLSKSRDKWDFGAEGVSTQMVYACFALFCKEVGGKPLKLNKFGAAAKKHGWTVTRKGSDRLTCYVVKRAPATTNVPPKPFPVNTTTATA